MVAHSVRRSDRSPVRKDDLKAGKLSICAVACCLAAVAIAAPAMAGTPGHHAANSHVTIYPWPKGLFGYVKSSASGRCASHRKVAVFRQHGTRKHPRADRRIARVRTTRHRGFYQWSVKTPRSGKFYAKARAKPGCRAAISRSLRIGPGTSGTGTGTGGYSPCSPYVEEANVSVCKFDGLTLQAIVCTPSGGVLCTVRALGGPVPWGTSLGGETPLGNFAWLQRDDRTFYTTDNATLDGTDPGLSNRFTVNDGWAQDDRGFPSGPHFYTPNLPGQAPGEVGGPLDLKFKLFPEDRSAAHIDINGYLYLKR
jgi:hypothetical protein